MVFPPPLLTRVSKQPIGADDATCLADGVCVTADAMTAAMAALATLAFAVAFLLALSRLHDAADALEAERERTREERDAFDAFADVVADIEPENPGLTDGGVRTASTKGSGTLSAVVDAYRDTVMALDHYDDEYDDTLAEHLAAEFGDDVALAVSNGQILSPQLQRTLCATALQARQRRDRLLSALDAERESLSSCKKTLRDVDDRLDEVDDRSDDADDRLENADEVDDAEVDRRSVVADWQSTQRTTERVEELLDDRQRAIHDQRHVVRGGEGPTAVYEYVYSDLDATYPVLSTATELLDRSRAVRRDLAGSLVDR